MLRIYLLLIVTTGVVLAQTSSDTDLSNPIKLPPELEGKVNNEEAENIKKKYLDTFKKKCEDNGHPETYDSAQASVGDFTKCIQSLVDVNVLENEIEEAKPEGKVDEVFKKYCNKRPDFLRCFKNMTDTMKPCFNAEEQKNFKTLHNITEQLSEFTCFKDGERIALFIAEGGKECFQDNQEAVQKCFNQTFDQESQDNIKQVAFNFVDSPMLEFKEEQCNQMQTLEVCVVKALERCESPTTSNIVESLFKFIRKGTPCSKFKLQETRKEKSSSVGVAATSASLLTALAVVLFL